MERECADFYYPPAVTKKILGIGMSVYTVGISLQKALGKTPFSIVHAEGLASYWIAFAYATLGVLLGVGSAIYSAKTSSLRMMGYLAAYLLAFAPASFINSPATVPLQIGNAVSFIGVSMAAFSAWLRFLREGT